MVQPVTDAAKPEETGTSLRESGEPVIRTVPLPADVNGKGDVFGGWILSHMDIAGGTVAARRAGGKTVTVAVDSMTFIHPVFVGDLVSIYAVVEKVGRTSISIRMETFVRRQQESEELKVTEGTFVYVAIDDDGRPVPVPTD